VTSHAPSERFSERMLPAFALHVAARVLETLAVAALTAGCVLAAAELAARASASRELLVLALVCAALCAACAWRSWMGPREDFVREADRRAGRDGEWVTAFELSRRAPRGALDELCLERALVGAGVRAWVRSVRPLSWIALAAPLLGLSALAAAREWSVRTASSSMALANLQLAESAAALRETSGIPAPEAETLARLADGLARVTESPASTADRTTRLEPEIQAALEQLSALEDNPRVSSALAGELRAARAALADWNRAAARLADDARGMDVPASADRTAAAFGSDAGASGMASTRSESVLASGASRGTIEGSPDSVGAPLDPAHVLEPAPTHPRTDAHGLVGTRWWPARFDGVVERWLQARDQDAQQPR
jgi:hypothetical protein